MLLFLALLLEMVLLMLQLEIYGYIMVQLGIM
jgi:hypothetical protein